MLMKVNSISLLTSTQVINTKYHLIILFPRIIICMLLMALVTQPATNHCVPDPLTRLNISLLDGETVS